MTANAVVLRASGISRSYGANQALKPLDLELRQGEVLGLIGQNGAGKSTLLKLLTGVEQPDSGQIELRGKLTRIRSVADAGHQGIGIVFQEQSLVTNLTVAENVFLGRDTKAVVGGFYSWRSLRAEAQHYLTLAGSSARPTDVVEDLSFADRQLVELAKVLALEDRVDGPLVILFDEPTSVLSAERIEQLFDQIRRLRSRAAIVFVSHRMDEVLEVSDRVLVLRDGEQVAESEADQVDSEDLYRLMVGAERASDYYASHEAASVDRSTIVMSAQNLHRKGAFDGVGFDLHRGEILGIAGVVGSGREALSRALFGVESADGGELQLDGRVVRVRTPSEAVQLGIGLIPAERRTQGMVVGRSVSENLTLAASRALSWGGILRRTRHDEKLVVEWTQRLKVKMPSTNANIERLSGGNQQKVVLAKWLVLPNLRVLILDHPTRGLDGGAKADVYQAIRTATKAGIAIVLLSDTLEELTGLADQVLVMRDGEVTGRFNLRTDQPSSEDLVRLMV